MRLVDAVPKALVELALVGIIAQGPSEEPDEVRLDDGAVEPLFALGGQR